MKLRPAVTPHTQLPEAALAAQKEFITGQYPPQHCARQIHMTETRIAPRYKVQKPAFAKYGGDKYPCTVRDLSTTGAAIEFSEPVSAIPIKRAFTLILPDDRLELSCRIVWQRDYRMGITFE